MTINYEEFVEKYKPIENHLMLGNGYDDCMYETYGEEIQYVVDMANSDKKQCVWTIIDADNENTYIIPGYSLLDRLGYLITEVPCDNMDIEVNDNEMLTLEESVKACIEFHSIAYGFTLDEYSVNEFFINNSFREESLYTIGEAKYLTIDYYENQLNNIEMLDDKQDILHDFYSQLK